MVWAQRALRFCFAAVAGALAATIAHVVIDVAGDYLLVRDSYDGVAHHSRALLLAVVGFTVLVIAIRTIVDALDLRGDRTTSLLALLRGALERPARFVATATIVAVFALAAMESFDCALAHQMDDLGDVFGGSLLLGLGTVVITGVLCGLLIYRLLRWLADYELPIAAFIVALLRPGTAASAGLPRTARENLGTLLFNALLRSQRGHKRGPPAPALS
jgi:hypothetical protein